MVVEECIGEDEEWQFRASNESWILSCLRGMRSAYLSKAVDQNVFRCADRTIVDIKIKGLTFLQRYRSTSREESIEAMLRHSSSQC